MYVSGDVIGTCSEDDVTMFDVIKEKLLEIQRVLFHCGVRVEGEGQRSLTVAPTPGNHSEIQTAVHVRFPVELALKQVDLTVVDVVDEADCGRG